MDCSGAVFVFTINLPNRMDEAAYTRLGFGGAGAEEAEGRIMRQAIQLFSTAFLARAGKIIVYKPLEEAAMRTLAAREIEAAVFKASRNCGLTLTGIRVQENAAETAVRARRSLLLQLGARSVLENARSLDAAAFVEYYNRGGISPLMTLEALGDGLRINEMPVAPDEGMF